MLVTLPCQPERLIFMTNVNLKENQINCNLFSTLRIHWFYYSKISNFTESFDENTIHALRKYEHKMWIKFRIQEKVLSYAKI